MNKIAEKIRAKIESKKRSAKQFKKLAAASIEGDDEQFLSVDNILQGSNKLLAINRGEAEPDDRDALQYKRIYSTGDLIAERIKIDAGKTARNLMRKLSKKKSLKYLPGNFLSGYTEGQLVGNPLSTPGEETNPILINEQQFRITQMGPGGIGTSSAITEEMQNVNPSEFGFLDVIAGPECFVGDSYVYTKKGWKLWPDVEETDEFLTTNGKELVYERPSKLIKQHFNGQLFGFKTKFVDQLVTPDHRVYYKRHNHKNGFKFTQAEKLFQKSQFCIPTSLGYGFPGDSTDEYFSIPHVERSKEHNDLMYGSVKNHDRSQTVLPEHHYKKHYSGLVYCATVTSGLLFVRGKTGIGYWSGNSEKAGIDVRATHNSRLGSDGRIYQKFYNPRLNQYEWLSAKDLQGKSLVFND